MDVNTSINITSNGADEAASALGRVNGAFKDLGNTHQDIKTRFAERFEHVGVHTFGHQLLELVGIHGQVRPILSAMSLAVNETAGAFGLAGGAAGLWVFGLGALAAILVKVISHHKSLSDELEKTIAGERETLKTTTELGAAIDEYRATVGELSPELEDVAEKTRAFTKAQTELLALDLRKHLEELNKKLDEQKAAYEPAIMGTAGAAAAYSRYAAGSKEAENATASVTHVFKEQDAATARTRLQISQLTEELSRYDKTGKLVSTPDFLKEGAKEAAARAEDLKKQQEELAQFDGFQTKMSEKTLALVEESEGSKLSAVTARYQKQRATLDSEFNHEEQVLSSSHLSFQQYNEAMKSLHDQRERTMTALSQAESAKRTQVYASFFGVTTSQEQMMLSASGQAFQNMSNMFAQNVTKMVFEGERWRQTFGDVLKQVTEMFFQAVLEMEIRWLAFTTMTRMGAFGGGGFGSGGGGALVAASGFSGVVDKPTTFTAGEAGPEYVSISPMGGSSAGGGGTPSSSVGGGGQTVINVTTYISGSQDPDAIGDAIVRKIRGMGQIGFTRSK